MIPLLDGYRVRLETERLVVQTLLIDNLDRRYSEWVKDPEITRYLEIRRNPPAAESIPDFVANSDKSENDLLCGIFLAGDERHIGNIKLGPLDRTNRRATMGLLIGEKDCWGKGYGTEAIRALSLHGLQELHLNRISAGAYRGNGGSIKAFVNAGYREEGVLRDYWDFEGGYEDQMLVGITASDLAGETSK